ncbi:MAG: DUF4919 domain-containing protein [Desulforhabdus sp.]|jgi:hypothetical protein|nr:DUF4919 domain-containing protein [Desulforhabdus sp.]
MRLLAVVISLSMAACPLSKSYGVSNEPRSTSSKARYTAMVEEIKAASPEADFLALRMAYVEIDNYSPNFGLKVGETQALFETMRSGDYSKCVNLAEEILEYNYTSLNAHFAAYLCNMQQNNIEKARFHEYVLKGLMDSIGISGDGKSPESAFVTINTEELHAFIRLMGFEIKSQSLINKHAKTYEIMGVIDPKTGEEISLYFDISIQMSKGAKNSK